MRRCWVRLRWDGKKRRNKKSHGEKFTQDFSRMNFYNTEKMERPEKNDWRRQNQESFLKGSVLIFRIYTPYRYGWDHDHCEFCGSRFSLLQADLKSGYSTEDGYHWVCEQCYNDFKEEFNW
jgi:hypothetical protein